MSQRSEEEVLAAMVELQQMGEAACLNGHRPNAAALLQEWLDLPLIDSDDDDLPDPPPVVDWLWDLLDKPVSQSECDEPEPLVIDADQWVANAMDVLKRGWQQFDRFSFRCENEKDTDGDLAALATHLWMQFDQIEPHIRQSRSLELTTIHLELEHHIDPDGVFLNAREHQRNIQRAQELEKQGKHDAAAQFRLPKDQLERPSGCSEDEWANIIKPFNRREYDETLNNFLARVEMASMGLFGGQSNAEQFLSQHNDDAHTKIREAIERGDTEADVQKLINQRFTDYNQSGLAKFAEQCRNELERRQDLIDALEDLLLRGAPPEIHLADYVPADWIPMFRVLRDGLKFTDEAIVMTVMAGVAAMLPPQVRIRGMSMEEIPTIWVFHIGTSGTAKSVLLRALINGPMAKPIAAVSNWNDREQERRKAAANDGEELPSYRKRNLIYTAPTTQGIRADLAVHGEEVPGLLVRDELNGWLKQMADDGGAGVGDVEFWLSSYDGAYSNDVFADAKKSREVRAGKLGVIGGIQPKVFLEQLEAGNANGFNSRPLFVHLPRLRRTLVQDDEMTAKLSDHLGELYLAALEESDDTYVLSREAEQLFISLYNQLEDLSLQAGTEEVEALWAKGPGQVLRVAAAIQFLRIQTKQEEHRQRGFASTCTVVSERSLQLAANLVMAGKTRAVELHERASNPMLERADKLLEKARKKQGKAPGQGVALSAIRKGWSSKDRPSLADLKQMAVMLQSRGLVQLLDGGNAIRVVR